MEAEQERRRFGRIHLLAHGRDKICSVRAEHAEREAALIDISAGGARLKFVPPPLDAAVRNVVFSVRNLDDGGLLQSLSATVQWRRGDEVGVQFRPELDVPLQVLQRLVG
ncbi:MAG TPA: PilZ domain-containing protein [Humidesulfovibrio sp.]|uniref:PilZ domain-containing protein n=1 Tax=Humidesulfovibrio sp. TaxID=2910988 RepID=UPI002BC9847B|nr:PilZ domain-containing protein [Humidesulfovibrio sp.]HWR04689.1 PilZ domain-containing protein [Humidesulfovibrio sp.]